VEHHTLVDAAGVWLRCEKKCDVVLTEFVGPGQCIPDAIGWRDGISLSIECKVSRPDFHRDKNKRLHLGIYRWILCPRGLIEHQDVAGNWGLLWYEMIHPNKNAAQDKDELTLSLAALRKVQLADTFTLREDVAQLRKITTSSQGARSIIEWHRRCLDFLAEQPGMRYTLKAVVSATQHPYKTPASARNALADALLKGRLRGCKIDDKAAPMQCWCSTQTE
jgi:hypothetical protein